MASIVSEIITHAGMLRPIKDQSTFAHSPEPEKTISKTSARGKFSIIKSSPGPHPGTFSGGRFCNQTCLEATRMPGRDVIKTKELTKSLDSRLFNGRVPIRNTRPSRMTETL
tara:strand:- start:4564 stop:4899 length:336 start_codon:yes stop_codon:yes gene_type:complete